MRATRQGRAALLAAPSRWLELGPGARTVELRDWFLPHLYQRGEDKPILPPAAPPPDKFDVFLSHNSADKPRVERLAMLLKNRHGLRVWFDAWQVGRGLLHEQCVEGVKKSRVTLIACTNQALVVPRKARDERKGCGPLKPVITTQWVRRCEPINPTRPKASHRAGSRTKVRPPRGGVRSRGEARTQAAELNSEKCIVVVKR
jgi:hypothetical protein